MVVTNRTTPKVLLMKDRIHSNMPKKLRICMLSMKFYPVYPGAGTRQPLTIADLFSKNGHNVQVVTSFPNPPGQKRPKEYAHKLFRREKMGEVDLLRVYVPGLPHNGMINRLILYTSFMFFSFAGLLSFPPADVLYLSDPYPQLFLTIPGYIYSKLTGAKLILPIQDLWPEVLEETGAIKSRKLSAIINTVIRFSSGLVDKVIVITNRLKTELIKKDIEHDKIVVIELPLDTNLFHPRNNIPYAKQFKDKKIVMYSGIYGPAYDFDTLLKTAKIMEKHSEILFVIRGDGERKGEIISNIRDLDLHNTVMLGTVETMDEVINCLSNADVFVVPMVKGDKVSGSTHPSKILEFMALEKPVVCAATDEIANLVNTSKGGLVVPPDDPVSLANSILRLLNSPKECVTMGKMGRRYVLEYFSFSAIHQKLIDVMDC